MLRLNGIITWHLEKHQTHNGQDKILMSKKNIQATFYSKEPLGNDTIQIVGWSGNHWDDISYFPKNYQIGLVRQGKGEFKVGNNNYPINNGQLFLIHPGKIHSGKPDFEKGWTVDTIALKASLVFELFNNSQTVFNDTVVTNSSLKETFEKTFALLSDYKTTFENESNLYLLITDLFKGLFTTSTDDDFKVNNEAIDRAINFITTNYKQSFSLDELADQAFLSKFHLLRIFKKRTGLTPYTYQTQLKLNEARKLIFQDRTLTEIAYELGFADQAHFTNTFKKYANGANPSDLLKTAISFNFEE
jgi:AraC-like DNA-binding protein